MKTSARDSSKEIRGKTRAAALSGRKTIASAGIPHPLIDSGSRMAAQTKLQESLFGRTAQRQSLEEDELLQGKSAAQNGNRYSQHLVKSMNVQAKLSVSAPNDVYEQEADKVAEAVTRAASSQVQSQPEEEEELQTKPASEMQRQEVPEEEEELQMQLAESQPATVSENLENRIKAARGSGHPLPDVVQKPMGRAFGADFSGVRVHTDSEANALNRELSAKAFTTGGDIFFRQGEYSPGSDSGKKLIAHELTHTVQQTGRKKPQHPVGEETQMKLDTSQSIPEDGQINPEMESGLQPARTSMQSLDGSVQRMVVAATDNIANVTDTLVWNNLEYAKSQAGGPTGDLTSNRVWDQLDPGEEVRIVGHGSSRQPKLKAGNVWYDAGDIKDSMAAGGLDVNTDPNAPILATVTFQSCYAGVKGTEIPDSLIGNMGKMLRQIGQKTAVIIGRTGVAFGFKGMGEATAVSSKAYTDTVNQMKKEPKWSNLFDPVTKWYKAPWDLLNVDKATVWDTWDPKRRMDEVTEAMKDYWKELKGRMELKGGFKLSPTDIAIEQVPPDLPKPSKSLWERILEWIGI